jgi:hypothetical protein
MRGSLSRMSLRSSGLHRSTRRASSRAPATTPAQATVARMSAAICGAVLPGCRFAHPGYIYQHHCRGAHRVARMRSHVIPVARPAVSCRYRCSIADAFGMVPLAGIEPALLAELDFESSASTNSATGASGRPWQGRTSRSRRNIAGAPCGSTRAYRPSPKSGKYGSGRNPRGAGRVAGPSHGNRPFRRLTGASDHRSVIQGASTAPDRRDTTFCTGSST